MRRTTFSGNPGFLLFKVISNLTQHDTLRQIYQFINNSIKLDSRSVVQQGVRNTRETPSRDLG